MTPQQQTALEALAGRALTQGEVEQIDGHLTIGNHGAIAAILSLKADGTPRERNVEIEAWRAARYFIKRGKWQAILAVADNTEHPARAAAQAARDLASVAGMMVDLADPDAATQAMWGGLVASGLVTTAERDELQSWCLAPDPITNAAVTAAIRGAA